MNAKRSLFFLAMTAALVAHAGQQPGSLLWSYDTGSAIITSPALASDGTILVGNYNGLCAITNNGLSASNKWTLRPAYSVASAAIGPDGEIYVGAADGNLYSINGDGSIKWGYPALGRTGSPAISYDNTIYYQGSNFLYAFTPSGDVKWTFTLEESSWFTSPAIGRDGTIYVPSLAMGQLYAINPDGSKKWAQSIEYAPADSPAIGIDGTIYVNTGTLYAFAQDGTLLWSASANNLSGYSPAVSQSGAIYIKDFNYRTLDALGPTGQLVWRGFLEGAHGAATVPALDSRGSIYYCFSNTLAAITAQGTAQWTFVATPEYSSPAGGSPIISGDGTIYAVFGTKLYAICGTNRLADSAWPMHRQNARHTGKIERPSLVQPKKRADANLQFQLFAQIDQPKRSKPRPIQSPGLP